MSDIPMFAVGIPAAKVLDLIDQARAEHQWADIQVKVRRQGGYLWCQCTCGRWLARNARKLERHQLEEGAELVARWTTGNQ